MISNSSTTVDIPPTFDPVQALLNPKTIPPRILVKCKQMLLSTSPIITRTCWNRRFGGNASLCSSAIQLLVAAGLLQEGEFAASGTKVYLAWMKSLPTDPTDKTITLNFQQNKLDMLGITWQQYSSSFKQIEFGHGKTMALVSDEGAKILRTKPYRDIGFILDEAIVLAKGSTGEIFIARREINYLKRTFLGSNIVEEQNRIINLTVDSPELTVPMLIHGKISEEFFLNAKFLKWKISNKLIYSCLDTMNSDLVPLPVANMASVTLSEKGKNFKCFLRNERGNFR